MQKEADTAGWEGVLKPGEAEKVDEDWLYSQLEFMEGSATLLHPDGRKETLNGDITEVVEEKLGQADYSTSSLEYRAEIEGLDLQVDIGTEEDGGRYLFSLKIEEEPKTSESRHIWPLNYVKA